MARIARLKQRSEFLRAASQGRKWATRGLVLQAVPSPASDPPAGVPTEPRIGFTASKRVGGAVERNRAKRRLRAAVDRVIPDHAVRGYDYVVIARPETLGRPFDALVGDLRAALGRLGLDRLAAPKDRDTGSPASEPPVPRRTSPEARNE